MKVNTSFTPNKKLILHFDVDEVLKINSKHDKDFFVHEMLHRCTNYVLNGSGADWIGVIKMIPIKLQGGNLLLIT